MGFRNLVKVRKHNCNQTFFHFSCLNEILKGRLLCGLNQGTEMKFSVKDRRVQKPAQLSALIPLSRFSFPSLSFSPFSAHFFPFFFPGFAQNELLHQSRGPWEKKSSPENRKTILSLLYSHSIVQFISMKYFENKFRKLYTLIFNHNHNLYLNKAYF